MALTLQTTTPEQTMAIGERLAHHAVPNSTIILDGQLGAGKTTFTKGFAQGLGITRVIKSPTYTLIREYRQGRLPLFHMDMYRIEESGGVGDMGLEEYFEQDGVVIVEWANAIESFLPSDRLVVTFERTALDERTVTVSAVGERYEQWLAAFEEEWSHE